MIDLTSNYFELFELPVACDVDQQHLSSQYRALQRVVHPDRFAGDSNRQQRLSVQYASHVNHAFNTLKSPLSRFIYLLKLAGRDVDMERNTVMGSAFLMEQLALREAVAEVPSTPNPLKSLEALMARVKADLADQQLQFAQLWAVADQAALDNAETVVKKMQFMVKLTAELEQLEFELDGE